MMFKIGKLNISRFSKIIRYNCTSLELIATDIRSLLLLSNEQRNSDAKVQGWVRSVRKMKDLVFVDVVDGSCPSRLQVVLSKAMKPTSLLYGASIEAIGKINTNEKGQVELLADNISIIGESHPGDRPPPFTVRQSPSYEYCRQILHLRPQVDHFAALLRLRHKAINAVNNFFSNEGFVHIHTPILTSNDCEGAGEVFSAIPLNKGLLKSMSKPNQPLDTVFFNTSAYLTVSGQLHLEAVCRSIFKVYTANPTFRAENSKSRLHLSEFYMIEAEEAFVVNIETLLNLMEHFIKSVTKELLSNSFADMELILKYNNVNVKQHFDVLETNMNNLFVRLNFNEAASIIKHHKHQFKSSDMDLQGFSKEHELFLVQHFGNVPVFVYNWPRNIKPFYMKTIADTELVSAVDLLVPNVGELCGGSLREDDFNILKNNLIQQKLESSMDWYLDLRRFGNVPTGGFGMGFERYLQWITAILNIKDVIPFPRWPHSLQM